MPPAGASSEPMLAELLARHMDMVGQLQLECREVPATAGFLAGLIAQHEKLAALIRALIENREVPVDPDAFVPFLKHATLGVA